MLRYGVFICLMVISLASCAQETKPEYMREQCIVRINIKWENFTGERNLMLESIMDAIKAAPDMGFNRIPPSSAVQGDRRQYIYYQFKFDCENKINNAKKLVKEVEKSIGINKLINVDANSYKPGPDTIRVTGKWWVDGKSKFDNAVETDGESFINVE